MQYIDFETKIFHDTSTLGGIIIIQYRMFQKSVQNVMKIGNIARLLRLVYSINQVIRPIPRLIGLYQMHSLVLDQTVVCAWVPIRLSTFDAIVRRLLVGTRISQSIPLFCLKFAPVYCSRQNSPCRCPGSPLSLILISWRLWSLNMQVNN